MLKHDNQKMCSWWLTSLCAYILAKIENEPDAKNKEEKHAVLLAVLAAFDAFVARNFAILVGKTNHPT